MEGIQTRPLRIVLGGEELDELRKRKILEDMEERGVSSCAIQYRRAILNRGGH